MISIAGLSGSAEYLEGPAMTVESYVVAGGMPSSANPRARNIRALYADSSSAQPATIDMEGNHLGVTANAGPLSINAAAPKAICTDQRGIVASRGDVEVCYREDSSGEPPQLVVSIRSVEGQPDRVAPLPVLTTDPPNVLGRGKACGNRQGGRGS